MRFRYRNMDRTSAEEICYKWKYKGIYAFYNMTEDRDDLNEFLDSGNWHRYFAAFLGNDLTGFFMYKIVDNIVYIGLGLKPALTGKGLGEEFILSGLEHLRSIPECAGKTVRLCVAQFNERAISLYRKIGFIPYMAYREKTNGGEYPFIKMEL